MVKRKSVSLLLCHTTYVLLQMQNFFKFYALHSKLEFLLEAFIFLRNVGREILWLEIFTFQTAKGGLHKQQQ